MDDDERRGEIEARVFACEQVNAKIEARQALLARSRTHAQRNVLLIEAFRLEVAAQGWSCASQENLELSYSLRDDDPDERGALDNLLAQRDEYRSKARALRAQAAAFKVEAEHLRDYSQSWRDKAGRR